MAVSARLVSLATAASLGLFSGSAAAQTVTTFSNPAPIAVADGSAVPPTLSVIGVSGLSGFVVKIRVTLRTISHVDPRQLSIWLVAPGGQRAIVLMARAPQQSLDKVTLQFDDCAPRGVDQNVLAGNFPSGTYRPTVGNSTLAFGNVPPPTGSTFFPVSSLAGLKSSGAGSNGDWALYIRDNNLDDRIGVIADGWSLTLYTQPYNFHRDLEVQSITCATPDYDGDGLTDVAVYRPASGDWFIFQSSTQTGTVIPWGAPAASGTGDVPVPADYDGDGQTDVAIYRETTGTWYMRYSFGGSAAISFGAPSALGLADTPVPGDYDGDGTTDLPIYRAGTGEWFIRHSDGSGISVRKWGAPALGDLPARR
jgi:subtilisin-like proprotein convertase family protein